MRAQLKKDEEIIFEVKAHLIILTIPLMITLFGIIISLFIKGYGIALIAVLICYFVFKIIQRNNNLWAVTNLRVIDESGVFSNYSKESPLDKINNISYKQTMGGKIWGYGDVQIQTAAEMGSTTYNYVSKPKQLKDAITRMQVEFQQNQIERQANEIANAISTSQQNNKISIASELEKLFELKQKGVINDEEYKIAKAKIINS